MQSDGPSQQQILKNSHTYPCQLQSTENKINEVENQILKMIIKIKQKQLAALTDKDSLDPKNQQKSQPNIKFLITTWQKEDEIDRQSTQYINKFCTFYEEKLLKEETKFIELRNQSKQRISNQEGQITHLKQQLERTQKEADRARSRIKKLETDWEEVKNYRKNQKERIIEMLIQQKQQIYTKYNQIEKENMVLLQFVHKMEDLLQKKTDEKEQDPSKISIIKQIQLEASKFYSSLTSPIIQQILNSFTQAINSLYKKFEKLDKREETKSSKKQRESRISNGVPTLKLKSSMGKQRSNMNFEIAHLKEQIAKITATYQQRLKQMQNCMSFEKQKGVHMKKKIEKYEEQLQKRNNQMQVFQLKQEDTIKKMKWLQQSLLDYKRKLKMEKDDFQTIIKRGTSTIEQQKPVQIEDERKKLKSKSLLIEKIGSLSSETGIVDTKQAQIQINEEFKQQQNLREIKELERKIRKADDDLLNKNEKLQGLEKQSEELKRIITKNKTEIDEKSSKLEQQSKKLEQKDIMINSLNIQVHKLAEQLAKKQEDINTLSLELQQKSKQIKIKQDRDEVILQMLSNIIRRQPLNCQFRNQMSLAQTRNQELINEIEQFIRKQSSQLLEKEQKLTEKQQQIARLQIQKKEQIEKMINQLKLITQKNEKEQQDRREDYEKTIAQMKKLEEYNRKLQDQLKNKQDEEERTIKKLEQLQKVAQQAQKVKSDLAEKQQKLREIKQAHMYPEQQFSKQKSSLLAEIQVQKQEVIEYELKCEELSKQFENLNKTMIQKEQQLAKQRSQINSLKKLLQNLQLKQKQQEFIINSQQNQIKQKQETISQNNFEIEKFQLLNNHQINDFTLIKGVLLEKQKLIQENKVEINQLNKRIAELEEKVNQSRENHDSEADNQQNLNQSTEINMMQEQIISFKEQLYNLLGTIKQKKDDEIKQLTATLRDKTQEQNEKKRKFSKTKSLDINLQAEANGSKNKQETMSVRDEKNEEVQRLTKIIIEQEQQIEILKTHLTKKQILSSKVMDLQSILDKEKQMYQNQLTKNHEKILNLQSQIRQLKQSPVKNKRVLSEEYFSIQPISNSNKVSSEEKFKQKSSEKNIFNNLKQKNSNDEGGSEVFHSLEEDFVEETKNRRKEAQELDKEIRGRIRREKSQELQRSKYGQRRVQKMSSIQKCYDSDFKFKEQNDMKYEVTPIKKENFSPIDEKIHNNIEKQKAVVKGFPSIASHDEIPHITNSDNSALNELIKSLTEENKNLKIVHEKLKRDFVQISQLMQIFDKNWKNQKTVQNCSELGKLVSTQKLMENIKLLENNKLKLFEEFNSSDMEAIFDNMTKLINDTKRWVELIQRLTVQNNKASLQMALFKKNPKLIKTKTSRVTGQNEDHHRRSRSVYSEGNVYKQLHIDVDEIPFELHDDHQPATQTNVNVPTNSLQMLFKENIEMSEISSVRNKSHNSGFLNSKSEIAKMFEKGGERQQKDHKEIKKQEQNKKDIVDDYITLNMHKVEKDKIEKTKNHALNINLSSNKIQQSRIQANLLQNSPLMQKNSSNYIQQASYQDIYYGKRLDDKSSKAKRKLMEKTNRKINTINSKISQNKKEFAVIIKNIIHKYEQKISQLQNQFSATVKKIMQFSTTIGSQKKIPAVEVQNLVQQNKQMNKIGIENSANGKCKVSGRISEKDEQLYQKVEELEALIQNYKRETQNKEKTISEVKEQSKQLEKKLKEQKAAHQNLKIKYLNEVSCSTNLKQMLGKKDQDFLRFITKVINTPKDKSLPNNEVSVQADPEIQSQLSPSIEGQKKFLKSKKNSVKNESLTVIEAKKIQPSQTKQAEISLQSKNQNTLKNETSIKTIEIANQNSKMENLLNLTDQIKENENIEKKETKQLQIATSFGRIKSEPLQVGNKRKQEKLRQSDKSESDSGKPLSIGAMINSILNPNTTLSKKKNISDVSKPDQVMYYQQLLKDINNQIKQVLMKNFLVDKVEDKKMKNSEDQIFKSKKQRETKVKVEQEKDKDKEKEKEKEGEKNVKDEQEINEKLKILQSQIGNFKKDAKKAKQEQQNRFRTILRRLIYSFKISKKSIEKVINQVEKQDNNNAAKYIDARIFFKSLYNQAKDGKQQTKTLPFQNNEQNVNLQHESNYLNDFCQQFESFEEKYNELQRQNDQLKFDLDIKIKQIQSLKQETIGHLDQKKTNSRNQSFTSYENDDQFEDFENKQIFDNTKPTFEVMETLKLELEFYKKKCEQFEASLNSKKSDKLKYIRRW